jgi:hypothetical protein
VHLVNFIIRIYHDARSSESQRSVFGLFLMNTINIYCPPMASSSVWVLRKWEIRVCNNRGRARAADIQFQHIHAVAKVEHQHHVTASTTLRWTFICGGDVNYLGNDTFSLQTVLSTEVIMPCFLFYVAQQWNLAPYGQTAGRHNVEYAGREGSLARSTSATIPMRLCFVVHMTIRE